MKSLLFWSAAALLVFGQVMIVRAALAGRTPGAGAGKRRSLELVWIVLPVVMLGATLAATWRARAADREPPAHQHGMVAEGSAAR
ncbi:MAG: hypothetical protein ACT4R6_03275 [Gemmatimonadaceae bacterium]